MKPVVTFLALASLSLPAAAADDSVPFPENYRDWRHVKSMVIEEGHPLFDSFGGIHHLYANEAAMTGYGQGSFPDGAVNVFDLLEAIHADNAVTEGQRKVLGVMLKDAEKFVDTGGWGFEGFAGGDPARAVVGADAASACYACHASEAGSDFVFSTLRD